MLFRSDPVVAPLIWQNGAEHNRHILAVMRMLPELFGFPVRTIAGISNLTSGPGPVAKKRLAEQAFISMLSSAGLSFALLDILRPEPCKIAGMCRRLINPGVFSWADT